MNSESVKCKEDTLAVEAGELTIGNDLRITRLGFGAARMIGRGIWGERGHRTEAISVLRRVIELSINFLDTADYSQGSIM